MRKRLGDILVAERLVSQLDVEEALQAQVVFGGRLGTNLVELERLDLDGLTRALSLQGGLPGVTPAELETATRPALALLTPAQAEKHLCIPLAIAPNRRSALVATAAPHRAALDELAFVLNLRLQAKVAPELRIIHWLERYYGIQRKQRFLRIGLSVGPGERRHHLAPLVPPSSPPPPAEPLPAYLSLPDASPPAPAPTMTLASPEMADVRRQVFGMSEDLDLDEEEEFVLEEVVPEVPHLSVPDVAQKMAVADSREAIADALVEYLRSRFAVGLVLMVRQEMALGWRGFSSGAGPEILENLALPLSAPSFFQEAYQARAPLGTSPKPEGAALQGRFFKMLGVEPPPELYVAPILIRDRVVSLLYAQPPPGKPLRPSSRAGLSTLALHAGTGFVRLIQRSKGGPAAPS